MDWIKKNYDRFALAVAAVILLGLSVLLLLKSSGFPTAFEAIQTVPPRIDKIPPLDVTVIADAEARFEKPELWAPKPVNGSLFVAWKYLIDPNTKQPRRIGVPGGEGMLHPPVPDAWLIKYELDPLSPTVLQADPDGDGFSNLDEYQGADRKPDDGDAGATDPRSKESHPPYHTKLFVKQYIKVPFRLLFNAVDGDPDKTPPEKMQFQINTLDLRQPSEFLKIGDLVARTKFKIQKYEHKVRMNDKTGVEEDVSELTVLNTETNEPVVLVLTKVTDSPDSFALFTYIWPQPPQDIRVKKLQEFVLRPNIQEKYKLIDIKETEAQITLPSGEKYTVPLLQR